ncbi:MAG: helix-turn-helix transcriptional regulator [Clostridia bacterium]|nr:helix-turn-helix transcriptional regulator [Clostridia bacterium]
MKLRFVHVNQYLTPITVKPHVHNTYELVYYIDGQGISNYAKKTVPNLENGKFINYTSSIANPETISFQKNECLLYPPGFVHDEQHLQPCQLVAVGFTSDDIPIENKPTVYKDYELTILKKMEKIAKEFQEKRPFYNKKIESILTDLFIDFNRKENIPSQLEQYNTIHYARTYIKEYFTTKINLEELAASTGYSPSRFRVLFRKETGFSPKEYILNKRLDHAKTLLETTQLPITEIAFLCGFLDYPQFNKFFNARAGMNPKEYRKRNKKPTISPLE